MEDPLFAYTTIAIKYADDNGYTECTEYSKNIVTGLLSAREDAEKMNRQRRMVGVMAGCTTPYLMLYVRIKTTDSGCR